MEKAMKKGICVAGNLIVDITYPIERWPHESELTTITEGITRSVGGAVCNDIVDLAKLDPELPLEANMADTSTGSKKRIFFMFPSFFEKLFDPYRISLII